MGIRTRTAVLLAAACFMALPVAMAADYKIQEPSLPESNTFSFINGYLIDLDNNTQLPGQTDGLTQPVGVTCETASAALAPTGTTDGSPLEQNPGRSELDPLRSTQSCEELRDRLQDYVYQHFIGPPPLAGCHQLNGRMNCYATQTTQCDVMATLYGNLIRVCVGGFSPYN